MKKENYDEIMKKLEEGVLNVYDSERYQDYLKFCSKLHRYSLNNQILIYLQKPDAEAVAGFTKWKELGRTVNKGEKGIMIISPTPYKKTVEVYKTDSMGNRVYDAEGNAVTETVDKKLLGFKKAYVFDVSQTTGKELPSLSVSELTASVENYPALFSALENVSPVPVFIESIESGAKGYYSPTESKIVVKAAMPQAQSIKTLIHEIAHSIVDNPESESSKCDRETKEVRAESVAFMVCDRLGIDTSDYSFTYIASWSNGRELKELMDNLAVIKKTADEILDKLEKELDKCNTLEHDTEPVPGFKNTEKSADNPFIWTGKEHIELPDYISLQEMIDYGYNKAGMLPLSKERAEHLWMEGATIYKIYRDGSEMEVADQIDIEEFAEYNPGAMFAIDQANYNKVQYGIDTILSRAEAEQKQLPTKKSEIALAM